MGKLELTTNNICNWAQSKLEKFRVEYTKEQMEEKRRLDPTIPKDQRRTWYSLNQNEVDKHFLNEDFVIDKKEEEQIELDKYNLILIKSKWSKYIDLKRQRFHIEVNENFKEKVVNIERSIYQVEKELFNIWSEITFLTKEDFIFDSKLIELLKDYNSKHEEEDKVKAIIVKRFAFFNGVCPVKQKEILNEQDFHNLKKYMFYFFKNNHQLPIINNPIYEINTTRTIVRLAFKKIYKELSPKASVSNNLVVLYRSIFTKFNKDSDDCIRKERENEIVNDLMKY